MHPHPPLSSSVWGKGDRAEEKRSWVGGCGGGCASGVLGDERRWRGSPIAGGAGMAMDFPVSPVDRLPIFPDEAASAAALMELIGAACHGGEESANGSRGQLWVDLGIWLNWAVRERCCVQRGENCSWRWCRNVRRGGGATPPRRRVTRAAASLQRREESRRHHTARFDGNLSGRFCHERGPVTM